MNIVFFTGNSPRHKAFVNLLTKFSKKNLVISEVKENYYIIDNSKKNIIEEHFKNRLINEIDFFSENGNYFQTDSISLPYGNASSSYVNNIIRDFNPQCAIIFGSSILKENIIQTLGNIPKINLHLGLTPYFRGSGCNFWPLYLNKPEFIGASIIELDSGIDTGDLIHQFNEVFTSTDTVHTIGNRVVEKSIIIIGEIIQGLIKLNKYKTFPQKKINEGLVFKNLDFKKDSLKKYYDNLASGSLLIPKDRYDLIRKNLVRLSWIKN